MVLRLILEHIILKCDGSGNMVFVFSDSVARQKGGLGGQNWHNSRDINFDTLKSFFRVSRAVTVQNDQFQMYEARYVCGYNYDFDPKIEIFGIGDPKMKNRNVSFCDS